MLSQNGLTLCPGRRHQEHIHPAFATTISIVIALLLGLAGRRASMRDIFFTGAMLHCEHVCGWLTNYQYSTWCCISKLELTSQQRPELLPACRWLIIIQGRPSALLLINHNRRSQSRSSSLYEMPWTAWTNLQHQTTLSLNSSGIKKIAFFFCLD